MSNIFSIFRYSSKVAIAALIYSSAPSAFKETADNDKELGKQEYRLLITKERSDGSYITYVELLGRKTRGSE